MPVRYASAPLALALLLASPTAAQWSTGTGGTAGRDGRSRGAGPTLDTPAWSHGVQSQVVQHPLVADGLVVSMHTTDWLSETGSWIVATDLATGRRRWATQLPPSVSGLGYWSRPVACRDGRVYATRGINGLVDEPLYALDLQDGSLLWTSQDLVNLGLAGTPTFVDGGDLVLCGRFLGPTGYAHLRVDAATGQTEWLHPRHIVAEDGGGSARSGRLYARVENGTGTAVQRLDPATGDVLYASAWFPAYTVPSGSPVVAHDGTVLVARRLTDLSCELLALDDTGAGFQVRWTHPTGPHSWASPAAVAPDGSVITLAPDAGLQRLDLATGTLLGATPPLATPAPLVTTRLAVDDDGAVFAVLTPTWDGELFAFDADLTPRWSRTLIASPFGGPSLAPDGSLVVATNGAGGLTVWR